MEDRLEKLRALARSGDVNKILLAKELLQSIPDRVPRMERGRFYAVERLVFYRSGAVLRTTLHTFIGEHGHLLFASENINPEDVFSIEKRPTGTLEDYDC